MFEDETKLINTIVLLVNNNNNIIILSFDIAPFPYKHAQRRITFIVRG